MKAESFKVLLIGICMSHNTAQTQIISQFTWDSTFPTTANIEPDTISSNSNLSPYVGRTNSTNGLNTELSKLDLDLTVHSSPTFNAAGIDISIDHQSAENSGSFFTSDSSLPINRTNQTTSLPTQYINDTEGKSNYGSDSRNMYSTDSENVKIGDNLEGSGSNTVFSDNLINENVIDTVLPIELIDLSVKNINNESAKLNWKTAIEINNNYFLIQRADSNFNWEEINMVTGVGIPSLQQGYEFTDQYPLTGTSYYRLKQVDYSGNFSYSAIESIEIKRLRMLVLNIYPNPISNQVLINVNTGAIHSICIYNSIGQEITSLVEINKTNKHNFEMSVNKIPKGIYTIKCNVNNTNISRKFTKK